MSLMTDSLAALGSVLSGRHTGLPAYIFP